MSYVITIGRQFGAGGRELGRLLSERLGIPFYDKELLLQAAKESGISPEFFINNDEKAPSFFNGLLPFSFGSAQMSWYAGPATISDDSIYKLQSDFMHRIAAQGPCIIVGRTADYVLRDLPNVLNIFLSADIEDCVDRIIKRSDCADRAKAKALAERTNKLRANFYNFYTDKTWGAAASYDMCFNTSRMPISAIADIVAGCLGAALGQNQ